MNGDNSDIGEDDMEELNEEDLELVLLDDILGVEGAEDDSDNENEDENDSSSLDEMNSEKNIRDDSDLVFKKHTGPIFCCALDPKNGNIAVTGAEDDKAYVWETQQGQVLIECNGHKDSVTMASFSFDGSYVATGDMSGLIQVWKVATKTLTWSDSIGDLSWMQWHHGTNALIAAVATGELFMWKIPSGECKVIPGHATTTDCGVIMPDGRRIAVGYDDGAVKVFELKTGAVHGSMAAGEAHSSKVLCVDAQSDNNIIATGSGEGTVNLYKTQPLRVLWSFECREPGSTNDACVEAVGFSKDSSLPLLAAGTLSGNLYILDFAKQVLRHKCSQAHGITRLLWDRASPSLFVAGLDWRVRVYDARNGSVQTELLGHRDPIMDICLSTDGNTLLSASEDCTCRVYAVSPPER